MGRVYATPMRDRVLALLKEYDPEDTEQEPFTAKNLTRLLGTTRRSVDSVIHHCRLPDKPKLVYIRGHVRNTGDHKGQMAPIYALGDLPDARPPRQFTAKQIQERYRQKHRPIIRLRDRKRRAGGNVNHWLGILDPSLVPKASK